MSCPSNGAANGFDDFPQFATETFFQHYKNVCIIRKPSQHLDDVWVVGSLQTMFFHIQVSGFLQALTPVSINNFHSASQACLLLDGSVHRSKGASSKQNSNIKLCVLSSYQWWQRERHCFIRAPGIASAAQLFVHSTHRVANIQPKGSRGSLAWKASWIITQKGGLLWKNIKWLHG